MSSATPPVTLTLGCDPQVNVTISETDTGTLFIVVASADPTVPVGDIDGVFFNLAQDSTLADLVFFPEANQGSIFSPVTGIQANANSVNTLSNGAQVNDFYDVGIQFGTTAGTTDGTVTQANFTLYSESGPLQISDLDLDSWATVVNSDNGAGQVLTGGDSAGGDPVFVDTQALFADFNNISTPTQSAAVESNDGWVVSNGMLGTNSCYEGELRLAEVATDGPASLSLDLRTCGIQNFENSGSMADSLRLEVQIDGGQWVLLDEFRVNDAGTRMVGSETGNTFGESMTNLTYSGGVLDTATENVQFRLISDLTATNEIIFVDNVEVIVSDEVAAGDDCVPETVLTENFDGISEAIQSDAIARADNWDVDTAYGDLNTDGSKDGTLQLETIQSDGPTTITFDAQAGCVGNFENSGAYADSLRLEVQLGTDEWVLLDEFRVNDEGTALVGSETGQSFAHDYTTLSYSGGILDQASGDVTFRFVSDISASNEDIYIDNIEVTACDGPAGDDCGQYDANYVAGIPIIMMPEETQEVVAEADDLLEEVI